MAKFFTRTELQKMAQGKKTDIELDWLIAYHTFCRRGTYAVDRPIIITAFDGHYGRAGFVIAINGSPMHGTMIVKSSGSGIDMMYVLDSHDKARNVDRNRFHLKDSIHANLWNATKALLVERGLEKQSCT